MPRIRALVNHKWMRSSVPLELLNADINGAYAVRRPLDNALCRKKLGSVLSHSGVVVITDLGVVLVEYMGCGTVFVNQMHEFDPRQKVIFYKHYLFVFDSDVMQIPDRRVTVRDFVFTMIRFINDRKFNLLSHNCHHARYRTMAFFGMHSISPDSPSVISQGWNDIISNKTRFNPQTL